MKDRTESDAKAIIKTGARAKTNKIRFMITVLLLLCGIRLAAAAAEPFALHLLDVGQGQSVLIGSDGNYMLIDGGGRDSSSFVVSYLKQLGIGSLAYIAASHYDEDHMSGLIGALSVFPCQELLLPSYAGEGALCDSFAGAALANGCHILHPSPGDMYTLGQAQICVVGPLRSDYSHENDRSLCFRVVFGDTSCLICGDAQSQSELDMAESGADLSADIYIVNHHGSATSSTDAFLDAVSPAYALISCGRDNAYGHPAMETLQRLSGHGCAVYRTDLQGTVIAYSDSRGIRFNQEPCGGPQAETSSSLPPSSEIPDAEPSAQLIPLSVTGHNSPPITKARSLPAEEDAYEEKEPAADFVCNTNTKRFHRPGCAGVRQMKEENRLETSLTREELIAAGYSPCGTCSP